MNTRRIRTIARKELLHIIRDPRSLGLALALPVVMLTIFGYALSLDVDRIRTAVYDADGSAVSADLTERFRASRFFDVARNATSQREIESMILDGRTSIGLSIPPN